MENLEAFQPIAEETNEQEAETEVVEVSPEREALMEEFREKRAGLLDKYMNAKTVAMAKKVGGILPGGDIISLTAAAVKGKTSGGEQLDTMSRVRYTAMAGCLTLTYVLLASGMHKEALAAKGAVWTLGASQFGPELLKKAMTVAQERAPEMVNFIQRTGEYAMNRNYPIQLELNG